MELASLEYNPVVPDEDVDVDVICWTAVELVLVADVVSPWLLVFEPKAPVMLDETWSKTTLCSSGLILIVAPHHLSPSKMVYPRRRRSGWWWTCGMKLVKWHQKARAVAASATKNQVRLPGLGPLSLSFPAIPGLLINADEMC